ERHILEKRKTTVCTDGGIFYNWLEEDRSTIPSTNPISKSLLSGICDEISAEETDEMGVY
ncbi:hypothetical protein ATL10_10785, partial [Bacillus sp. 196mf]